MLDAEGQALRAELFEVFRRGIGRPLGDEDFDRIAQRVFSYQYRRNRAYAAYCRNRDRTPDSVAHWTEIPAVPTAAFKEVPLVSGEEREAEAVFRTSGTTKGRERRGEHHVLDLSIYHAALLPNFAAYLLPDAAELPFISLIPPAAQLPDSSLAYMVDVVIGRLASDDGGYFSSVTGGLDLSGLDRTLREFEASGTPVCLLGTALSFLHWLEELRAAGSAYQLPAGSRLMDTGGFKGSAREVAPEELLAMYDELLGIPARCCVNEYGMTELTSQFYDAVLRAPKDEPDWLPRRKVPPPWVRTTVVDADTLEPLPWGEPGILRHHDLANVGSVAAVQTEDLGREVEGGFVLLGRVTGAQPRGCSIAMDELLRSAGTERS